jgi:polysaccharide biosynthesis protein PslG
MLSRRLFCLLVLALLAAPVSAANAAVPRDFVGVAADDLFAGDPAYRSNTLNTQRSVGVGLIRQTFDWSSIETAPGRYNLSAYDAYVASAAAQRVRVLPILFNPPGFRRRTSGRASCPPRRLSTMAAFARALVKRYGTRGSLWRERPDVPKTAIRSWQIWNEPNLGIYWCNHPNARAYARMLRVVGRAIRRSDRRAEVVTAGLPPSKLRSAAPLDRYLWRLYRAGAKRSFHTLAINSYAKNRRELHDLLRSTRRLMNRAHDRRGRIWLTELGWGDAGPDHRFIVGRAGQAARIRSSFGYIDQRRAKLRLRGVIYYSWRDLRPYPPLYRDLWGLHTGLLDLNGNPKPAFYAFSRAVKRLR